MRRIAFLLPAVATVVAVITAGVPLSRATDQETVAPIYGIKIPTGYRNWALISVASVGGPVNDMRAKLGNDVAIRAYREQKTLFPDGTIIARLAWKQATSEENN